MALLKCPDCFNDVSDLAESCPKCGRPMKGVPPLTAQDTDNHIKRVLVEEGKIPAIKLCREYHGFGLADAKAYVEKLEGTLPAGSKPKAAGCASVLMFMWVLAVVLGLALVYSRQPYLN